MKKQKFVPFLSKKSWNTCMLLPAHLASCFLLVWAVELNNTFWIFNIRLSCDLQYLLQLQSKFDDCVLWKLFKYTCQCNLTSSLITFLLSIEYGPFLLKARMSCAFTCSGRSWNQKQGNQLHSPLLKCGSSCHQIMINPSFLPLPSKGSVKGYFVVFIVTLWIKENKSGIQQYWYTYYLWFSLMLLIAGSFCQPTT